MHRLSRTPRAPPRPTSACRAAVEPRAQSPRRLSPQTPPRTPRRGGRGGAGVARTGRVGASSGTGRGARGDVHHRHDGRRTPCRALPGSHPRHPVAVLSVAGCSTILSRIPACARCRPTYAPPSTRAEQMKTVPAPQQPRADLPRRRAPRWLPHTPAAARTLHDRRTDGWTVARWTALLVRPRAHVGGARPRRLPRMPRAAHSVLRPPRAQRKAARGPKCANPPPPVSGPGAAAEFSAPSPSPGDGGLPEHMSIDDSSSSSRSSGGSGARVSHVACGRCREALHAGTRSSRTSQLAGLADSHRCAAACAAGRRCCANK